MSGVWNSIYKSDNTFFEEDSDHFDNIEPYLDPPQRDKIQQINELLLSNESLHLQLSERAEFSYSFISPIVSLYSYINGTPLASVIPTGNSGLYGSLMTFDGN